MSMYMGTLNAVDEALDIIVSHDMQSFKELMLFVHETDETSLEGRGLRNIVYNNPEIWSAFFNLGVEPPKVNVQINAKGKASPVETGKASDEIPVAAEAKSDAHDVFDDDSFDDDFGMDDEYGDSSDDYDDMPPEEPEEMDADDYIESGALPF